MPHTKEVQALIGAAKMIFQLHGHSSSEHDNSIKSDLRKALVALEPEPPKPREVWMTWDGLFYSTRDKAKEHGSESDQHFITHYREVLPEKPIVWMPEPDYFPWKDDTFKASYDLKINKNYYTVLRNYLMQLSHATIGQN